MLTARIPSFLLLAALFFCAAAAAQWSSSPTENLDARTLRIQSKVEDLYRRQDYERALFIYLHELVPAGDKYAQYMAGYMLLRGQGTARDEAAAAAWYRLAAERGAPEFVAARDALLGALNDSQRARSDALYVALRREYSDVAIVMRLVASAFEEIGSESTGSRLASGSGAALIVDPHSGESFSRDDYHGRIQRTLRTRLEFVAQRLNIEPPPVNMSRQQFAALQDRVAEYLAQVD